MNTSTSEIRESLLCRAEALGWPAVGCSGNVIGTEARWRTTVAHAFPVELDELAAQLAALEAARPDRLPEPRSALDPLPMMDHAELAAQEAERAEIAREVARERARQDEALRQKILADHGII